MKGILPLFTLCCLIAASFIFAPSVTAAEGELRVFTDKKGQKIEAILLDVAPDWKTMKIKRKDGKEFQTEIVTLSLDDQQYIKDWINNKPVKTDYRLDISIDTKLIKTDKEKGAAGLYTLETKTFQAEIKINNLSRDVLPAPVISYIILRKEDVRFYDDGTGSGTLTYTSPSETAVNKPVTIRGTESGQDIAFNIETSITTKPVMIDRLVYGSNEVLKEDKFLGILVQIKNQKGALIKEFLSKGNSPALKELTWEEALKLPRDLSETNDEDDPLPPATPVGRMVKGPSSHSLQKGDQVRGPIDVEKMPIMIKAHVTPKSTSKDGAIVSIGAKRQGLALFLEDDKLIGIQIKDPESARVIARPPLGEFDVELRLSETKLVMLIDGREVSSGTSLGLFKRPSKAGIEVGQDTAPTLTAHEEPFSFAGEIENVSVEIGP